MSTTNMIMIVYLGGPLDGETETRPTEPRHGDTVHRLVGSRYVTYGYDRFACRFVFLR